MDSLNSSDVKRQKLLQSSVSSQYMQFGQLQKEVSQVAVQNRHKYHQILASKPDFVYEPYTVTEHKSLNVNFGRELLMKQMDRLLEEEHHLNRELTLIAMREEELS